MPPDRGPPAEKKVYPQIPYERHVFVCCFGKTCPTRGGADIAGELKRRAKEAGVPARIRVNKSGCLNQCDLGPTIVVYPEGIWYGRVSESDVDEILEKTVIRGETVTRLLLGPMKEKEKEASAE